MEEDKYLYNEFLNGNKKAFEKLILKYKNNIVYFITRYVKIENKEKYDSNYSFKTYMYMIVKSKAIDFIRHEKYVQNIEETEVVSEELLEEIIFSKERKNKIRNIIGKMPLDYQIVIYLTQIDGVSYKETAKIMDKTEKQIKTLVYNARKKLKQLAIEERLIEMKNNKIIKLFLVLLFLGVVTTGIVYATIKIREKVSEEAHLTPIFTGAIGDTDINSIWVRKFSNCVE